AEGYRTRRRSRLLDFLRDRDQQHSAIRLLRVEAQTTDEDRSAPLDGVVGVQLARMRRMFPEQLQVHLDPAIVGDLPRRDLQAARPRQFHLGRAPEREVQRLLRRELEVAIPEIL